MPPFPAPAPTVNGNLITVDRYMRQPLEIARDLSDITLRQFFAEALFTPGPDVPSGAVVYDELNTNDVFPDRDVARHTAGAQFPLVISSRRTPKTAYAEEYGGKFYVTYQAIRRNAVNDFDRDERLLGNAMVRKWNNIALDLLNAAVDAVGASAIIAGADWSLAATDIFANLAAASFAAEQRELGITVDTVIVNPAQGLDMFTNEKFRSLFTDETVEELVQGATVGNVRPAGLTILRSFRQPVGQALALQRGVIGGRHQEAPSAEESDLIAYDAESGIAAQVWDDPENTRKWAQAWKSEVLYVNNPFAIYRIVGI